MMMSVGVSSSNGMTGALVLRSPLSPRDGGRLEGRPHGRRKRPRPSRRAPKRVLKGVHARLRRAMDARKRAYGALLRVRALERELSLSAHHNGFDGSKYAPGIVMPRW